MGDRATVGLMLSANGSKKLAASQYSSPDFSKGAGASESRSLPDDSKIGFEQLHRKLESDENKK